MPLSKTPRYFNFDGYILNQWMYSGSDAVYKKHMYKLVWSSWYARIDGGWISTASPISYFTRKKIKDYEITEEDAFLEMI